MKQMKNKVPFLLPKFSFPHVLPPKYSIRKESIQYNPMKHLDYSPPQHIYDLNFKKIKYETWLQKGDPQSLAFTEPFKILNEDSVKFLLDLIEEKEDDELFAQSNSRSQKYLTGLGFTSRFVRDLNECVYVDKILSEFARESICAEGHIMNYSYTNIGKAGVDRPVDAWHTDSVKYVMVVILSDTGEGGELEVASTDKDTALREFQENGELEDTIKVKYPGPGYAIFMQGSEIFHRVTPIIAGRKRISMVMSCMTRHLETEEKIRYKLFHEPDQNIGEVDQMRIKAWRVAKMMDNITRSSYSTEDNKMSKKMIRQAIKELQETNNILEGEDDRVGFIDQRGMKKLASNYI